MIRSLFLFDGANFYRRVKAVQPTVSLSEYNYRLFCSRLISRRETIVRISYYVGEIKQNRHNKKAMKLFSGQQKLFVSLAKQDITLKLGYMLLNNGKWQEKGVDVQIATDLIDGAADNTYDRAYLLSSDTDLIPAILSAQRRRKQVIYVGFEGMQSIALTSVCSRTILLRADDIACKLV